MSDLSSDVCSSDLLRHALRRTPILAAGYILEEDHGVAHAVAGANDNQLHVADAAADIGVLGGNPFLGRHRTAVGDLAAHGAAKIGRDSCREGVGKFV